MAPAVAARRGGDPADPTGVDEVDRRVLAIGLGSGAPHRRQLSDAIWVNSHCGQRVKPIQNSLQATVRARQRKVARGLSGAQKN
jgi:hypothetical protein